MRALCLSARAAYPLLLSPLVACRPPPRRAAALSSCAPPALRAPKLCAPGAGGPAPWHRAFGHAAPAQRARASSVAAHHSGQHGRQGLFPAPASAWPAAAAAAAGPGVARCGTHTLMCSLCVCVRACVYVFKQQARHLCASISGAKGLLARGMARLLHECLQEVWAVTPACTSRRATTSTRMTTRTVGGCRCTRFDSAQLYVCV